MGIDIAFGKYAQSASEYLWLLHNIKLINNFNARTVLVSRDEFKSKSELILSEYDTIIVEDWFGIDDWVDLNKIDNKKVIFCTTNMQQPQLKHARVIHYNLMFNRTKLFYTERFPITRNGRRYTLLLSNNFGENYKRVKYNRTREYDFMFLNAGRQTTERQCAENILKTHNGLITNKTNRLPNDKFMNYNPVPAHYWEACYFNICVESNVHDHNIVHTTEKIWEPIIKYQIPVVLATKHYQSYMESLGFVFPIKVFTQPEEYYNFLTEFFTTDVKNFFLKHEDCVKHNHNLFFNLPIDRNVEQIWKN